MPHYLSQEELQRTAPAETAAFASPVPTQIVSNGEFNPLPQTREQERVEVRIKDLAERLAPVNGMDRRVFLASTAGIAAAFSTIKGRSARGLRRCNSPAMSSFPVPLSPVSKTVAWDGATCWTIWETRFQVGLEPITCARANWSRT